LTATTEQASTSARARTVKLGVIGIGVGAGELLPAVANNDQVELVAGADVVDETRRRFGERYPQAKVYDSAEKLCADPNVEAVWVSTPNRFHAPHTILAANHGKHVVVEKPMAISLQEAEQMVEAAERNKVKLLAGHTQAYSLPIRAMRRVISSGQIGNLCALNIWSYSDWMLRPRTSDELDVSQGGGIPYRQGPHQIDSVRVLGGGKLRSVRGMTGQWFKGRPIPGYYAAYLEFEDGTPVTIVHNGYGHFLGNELVPWGTTKQQYTLEERGEIRKNLVAGTRKETEDKQDLRIGGANERVVTQRMEGGRAWLPTDLGFVIASCEHGDMRHSQHGIYIYDDNGLRDLELTGRGGGRRAELEELHNALVLNKPEFHDGRWGMATLEVCLAVMQSARERKEVMLSHQVAVPADYDADLDIGI
jgi:phthalate 4,5-cis-dihydrodiol dehydrogenase